MTSFNLSTQRICVIGQGYVGLPLALAFSKSIQTVGLDVNKLRIERLQQGIDDTQEANTEELKQALASGNLTFASSYEEVSHCTVFIVTVPTPIDRFKAPDLGPLVKASAQIGAILKKGDLVIYESTVYPGCTEEECVPILEKNSGLRFNTDFFVGYSPERINPGDKQRPLHLIKKVTSGSTPEVAQRVDALYQTIITAGTHLAPSIKVAEASKAIENAQRDVNISFVNELALIFDRIGIDTHDVLEAAGTKWNFLPYKPGLVGGHCIGVDPYYLAHKAESLGYHPQVILSGRRVNDAMGLFVANKVIKLMIDKNLAIRGNKALVLGITFKENCPDIRNSKAIDVVRELNSFGLDVDVYDPWALPTETRHEWGLELVPQVDFASYAAVVLVVAHSQFNELPWSTIAADKTVVYDVKGMLDRNGVDARL
ncbi:MAG TPA: nucleotide sugar dehydrogenase [Luteibaculaceae bacterium]|nr:nucleotide sugar dehydrogenase [Luteibaculaceae bacterium]